METKKTLIINSKSLNGLRYFGITKKCIEHCQTQKWAIEPDNIHSEINLTPYVEYEGVPENEPVYMIEKNRVACLLTYSIESLGLSLRELLELMHLLEKHEVRLVSVTEKLEPDTHSGRLRIHLAAITAEFRRADNANYL